MKRLAGKVALITGTGGGQGRAAALRFARVVGCDLHAESHAATRELLAAERLELHGTAPVDLGDAEQARA